MRLASPIASPTSASRQPQKPPNNAIAVVGIYEKGGSKEPPYYTKTTDFQHFITKSGKRDLNPWPLAWETFLQHRKSLEISDLQTSELYSPTNRPIPTENLVVFLGFYG